MGKAMMNVFMKNLEPEWMEKGLHVDVTSGDEISLFPCMVQIVSQRSMVQGRRINGGRFS